MFRSYLKIALRHWQKHRSYALINIVGLAVGMACCLMIVLFVRDELSFDRFHTAPEQIVRVTRQQGTLATSVAPEPTVGPAFAATLPEVTHATRLFQYWFTPLLNRDAEGFYEEDFFYADPDFFAVFDGYRLQRGDPATALDAPFSVVLTPPMAEKYFGTEDPVGQTLTLNVNHDFTVTGVLEVPPPNAHFSFDFLASIASVPAVIEWDEALETNSLGAFPTYLRLAPGTDRAALAGKLPALATQVYGENTAVRLTLQPLTDIHLYSDYRGEIEANSDIQYVYLLSAIAAIILLLACINYTNLATARFARRAREVGIRKVVGAGRRQLMGQFLGESVLTALVAGLAGLALLEMMLPFFHGLVGRAVHFSFVEDGWVVAAFLLGAAGVGMLAGVYPAFYLSAFQPQAVLKGGTGRQRAFVRKVLIVGQYAVAVVLIAGTVTAFRQLSYISTKKLGFETEQIVVLPVRDEQVKANPAPVRAAFAALPEVAAVSMTTSLPGTQIPSTSMTPVVGDSESPFSMMLGWVDGAYVETLDMAIVAGRGFDETRAADREGILLNETGARDLGWLTPAEAIGQTFSVWGAPRTVLGIVADFHFASLRDRIGPMLLFPEFDEAQGFALRLRTADLPATLDRLAETWHTFSPDQPFTVTFLDQELARLYEAERQWARAITSAALLALFIAGLGLFGLAAFAAEQRTKEIGVRKVLGASGWGIVLLLTGDFARLVGGALVVAVPVGYLVLERWLSGFAYHPPLAWWIFALAGGGVLLLALLTVSVHALRAARANPVASLRVE